MATHRYWRAKNLQAYGATGLDITEYQLFVGSTRVDGPATLTSNIAPSTGSLSYLQDGLATNSAIWLAADVPKLVLSWDFGSTSGNWVDVNDIQLGGGALRQNFLAFSTLQYSDDASTWTDAFISTTNGYVAGAYAWPGSFTATTSRPFSYNSLTVLLHGDGTDGGTTFTDSSTNAFTVTPTATTTSATQKKFGTTALSFNGATCKLLIAHNNALVPSGDFCIQCYVWVASATAATHRFIVNKSISSGVCPYAFAVMSTGVLSANSYNAAGTSMVNFTATQLITAQTWTHVAFTRQGLIYRIFMNGQIVAQATAPSTGALYNNNTHPMCIGNVSDSIYPMFGTGGTGYIDEFSFDANNAVYTAPFIPPAAPGSGGGIVLTNNFAISSPTEPSTVGNGVSSYGVSAVSIAPETVADVIAMSAPTVYGVAPPPVFFGVSTTLMLSYGAGLRAPNNTRGRNDFVTGVLGSGVGRIDGVVQVPGTPNQPVKRRVRLYRQEDGYLVREAWSDSSTGAFSFDYVDEKQLYYICAFDHTNAFVGLIADNLTPSLLETSTVDAYAGALKRLITITGAGGAGTGYAMLFKIGESSGSAGSDFNLEAVTTTFPLDKNIPGDVQFTDVSGSPLPQWVEQVTGTAPNRVAWFWVKVSADLSTTQSIYCTYRNGMSTASNGNTVFLLFDDFDDGTLDTGKWSNVTGSGSYVISGSEFVLTGTGVGRALYSATTFGDGMEVVGKVGPSATSLSYNGKFGFETQYIFQNDWDSQGSSEVVVGPSTKTQLDARYQTTYYRMRIRRAGGAGSMLVNDVVKHTQGSGIGTSSVPVWLMNVYDATVAGKVDWIAVKKYMLTEPTYYSADTSIPAATTVINMTFDTGNGSTTFTDTGSQASSWQIGTGAVQCSTTAVLEGVSSLFVPGGGFAYLYTTAYSANMLPATSDFSLKFKARSSSWLRFDASGCYLISIQGAVGNGADTQFAIATNLNTYLAFAYSDGTTRSAVTGTTPVPVNVTVSFEFKRVGSTLSLLMNGVLQCSATLSGALNVPSGQQWRIGAPAGAQGGAFNGMYFDSLSLTVG